jgi:hypothetical protein
MSLKSKIFAELEGFAIYEPSLMNKYVVDNNIGNNLLSYLITSELGDIVTQNGVIIPIIGIPADYYKFKIIQELPKNYLIESKGWILKVETEKINVIGIGYLADVTQITTNNSLSFSISNGWYELSIISYLDSFDKTQKCFGLKLKQTPNKPVYSGNMETNYLFE